MASNPILATLRSGPQIKLDAGIDVVIPHNPIEMDSIVVSLNAGAYHVVGCPRGSTIESIKASKRVNLATNHILKKAMALRDGTVSLDETALRPEPPMYSRGPRSDEGRPQRPFRNADRRPQRPFR